MVLIFKIRTSIFLDSWVWWSYSPYTTKCYFHTRYLIRVIICRTNCSSINWWTWKPANCLIKKKSRKKRFIWIINPRVFIEICCCSRAFTIKSKYKAFASSKRFSNYFISTIRQKLISIRVWNLRFGGL